MALNLGLLIFDNTITNTSSLATSCRNNWCGILPGAFPEQFLQAKSLKSKKLKDLQVMYKILAFEFISLRV